MERLAGFPGVVLFSLVLLAAVFAGCGGGQEEEPAQGAQEEDSVSAEVAPEEPSEAGGRWEDFVALPLANETCLECHDTAEISKGERQDEFSHALHLRQLIACVACHGGTGHEGKPAAPREVCRDCHGLPMPHAPNYETTHGEDVREQGEDVCRRCHNVYLHCQECHAVQMPHPTNWAEKHGEVTYSLMGVCSRCHDDQYCLRCHPVEMPHPQEWTRTHGLDIAEQGSEVCTTCHEPALCTVCHGMPMPHPEDWDTKHPEMAEEKRGECMLCHMQEDCTQCHEIHETHGQGRSD